MLAGEDSHSCTCLSEGAFPVEKESAPGWERVVRKLRYQLGPGFKKGLLSLF
jgi:hypothetical protein